MYRSALGSLTPYPLVTLLFLCATVATVSAADAAEVAEFPLEHARAADAATTLRVIADIKDLEIGPERTVTIRGTEEQLSLAEQLLKIVDSSPGPGDVDASVLPFGDLQVLSHPLRHAAPLEVLKSLRKIVQVRKVVILESHGLVIVSDKPERVDAARALIELLDRAAPCLEEE